uniref:COMM domain-containing protein n=1 Tax=Panagrellus redivivus TaxID=6233 RepID=A0A7E4V0X7_PANRE
MATSIKLPLGSSHAIKLFGDEKLDYDFVKTASKRCLESLPTNFSDDLFNDSELAAFSDHYAIPKPELTLVISMLKALWKQVVFHALKKDAFAAELARLNFTEAKIEALGTIWAENGEETLKRLRNISHSGTPRLNGVNWFIGIERATSYTSAKRDLRALLRLDTSDGDKFQKLGYEELVKLHYQLQTVQDKMDSLIK